ncbi:hypothetical protein K1T71_004168 [Dendrolimus kikuchii]|uniref:Uncharacterized protein n=1 Tax=Dendrolimus kikuchii TaxID=765133 RepID=A0ACC1DA12_9NEOP|nr:hypothetical protein K1T71_004168 [Dendrolimus kikuchii]
MLPGPLAPLDPHKTRALTTIYAPRKLKPRMNKTAQSRMIENDIQIKPTLSPFHPLPAIGQKLERSNTKVILFNLNKNNDTKLQVLKPLTPLRIHGFARKNSLDLKEAKKPQQLLRENTYDVIEPVYVNGRKESSRPVVENKSTIERVQMSPKTRFKKAAMQVAKMSSMTETGKLLCLRERQTFDFPKKEEKNSTCILQQLPHSPAQNLNKLSEIFQSLEMKGKHRDRMKKENSWF